MATKQLCKMLEQDTGKENPLKPRERQFEKKQFRVTLEGGNVNYNRREQKQKY